MAHDRIKAVLFDLGDTVLNFGQVSTTRAFLAGARLSHAFLKEQRQPVAWFPWYFLRNLIRLRIRYLQSNLTHKDFDSFEVLRAVGVRQGVVLSQAQWERFAWLWYEPLSREAIVEPDLRQTLDTLRNMGVKLGIVSNTFVSRASLEKHLRQLGLLEFFPVQLYSYEYHVRKPSAELLRIAAAKIGESVGNILFVGDRIDNDILPALASGMHAVLKDAYTNAGKPTPRGARRIRLLSELTGIVEQLNAPARSVRV
ncbi:MAG: HAD family hydrolase [Solirubrobacterales bacterium]